MDNFTLGGGTIRGMMSECGGSSTVQVSAQPPQRFCHVVIKSQMISRGGHLKIHHHMGITLSLGMNIYFAIELVRCFNIDPIHKNNTQGVIFISVTYLPYLQIPTSRVHGMGQASKHQPSICRCHYILFSPHHTLVVCVNARPCGYLLNVSQFLSLAIHTTVLSIFSKCCTMSSDPGSPPKMKGCVMTPDSHLMTATSERCDQVKNHPGLTPKQKGCVLPSCSQCMTARSVQCEQVANHPGLSPEGKGSGMKAGLRRLTTVSTDCDKADFPPQLSCEMRVRVGVSGEKAPDEAAFPVLSKNRKNGGMAARARREALRAIGHGKVDLSPPLSHEIKVSFSVCGITADPRTLTAVLGVYDTVANHTGLSSKRKGVGMGVQALRETTRAPIRLKVRDELDFHTHGVSWIPKSSAASSKRIKAAYGASQAHTDGSPKKNKRRKRRRSKKKSLKQSANLLHVKVPAIVKRFTHAET